MTFRLSTDKAWFEHTAVSVSIGSYLSEHLLLKECAVAINLGSALGDIDFLRKKEAQHAQFQAALDLARRTLRKFLG